MVEEYYQLKEDIMEYTEEFHDAMLFDYEGYVEAFYNEDYDEFDDLNNQVKAFRKILEGLKEIKYVFG